MTRVEQYLGLKEDADFYGGRPAMAFVLINALPFHRKAYLAWLMLLDTVCKR